MLTCLKNDNGGRVDVGSCIMQSVPEPAFVDASELWSKCRFPSFSFREGEPAGDEKSQQEWRQEGACLFQV